MDSVFKFIHRDVMHIVHKYVWRDNYNRCIEEYTRIYGPHWISDYYSECYYDGDGDVQCPILNNGNYQKIKK